MINIKKIGFGLINILVYIFLTQILATILNNFNLTKNILALNFILLIVPIIVLLVLIFLNKEIFKNKWQDFTKNKKKYFILALKYYCCGVAAMYIGTLIVSLFSSSLPVNEEQNRELIKLLPIYSIISMVFIAPLSEEITFRGSFKNISKNKIIYLLITSLMFGLMHVIFNSDYINILPYSAFGFFLGKIYYETDNIYVNFMTHSFHNLLCILLIFAGGAT